MGHIIRLTKELMNDKMLCTTKYLILTISIIVLSCGYSDKEVFLYEQSENWGEWHAGDYHIDSI